jgi:histidinol-phosphatase (PHP family)
MICNLHTHTNRADGSGKDEEYVLRAIEKNIKTLGFSDHVPLRFEDGFESSFRVPISQAREYIEDLKVLKERYKNQIEIFMGFELEYYPKYFEKSLSNIISWGAEYLILGQHFVCPENLGGIKSQHVINGSSSAEILREYAELIVQAIQTNKFTYVAHPDMFLYSGDLKVYKEQMRKICVAAKKTNTPLEINLLGIRGKRCYPNQLFWEIAGEEGVSVVFGSDAHNPIDVYDESALEVAKGIVDKYKLNYLEKPPIKFLTKRN